LRGTNQKLKEENNNNITEEIKLEDYSEPKEESQNQNQKRKNNKKSNKNSKNSKIKNKNQQ
jgi:hypothetical protein